MNSEEFKKTRINKGYTQKSLAKAIGFSEDYISKIERGERPVTDYILEKLNHLQEKNSTMEVILDEADEKNKRKIGQALAQYGDEYQEQTENIERAKMIQKSIIERAEREGITKGMIASYCVAINLDDFNLDVLIQATKGE
uniref:HTH XrE protein n=1 Tax=Dulem virus 29 TaxID=3145747 RepID=A0AAU8AY63_9CAUD